MAALVTRGARAACRHNGKTKHSDDRTVRKEIIAMMMFGMLMMLAMVLGMVVVGVLIGVGIWLAIRWIGRQSPRLASPGRHPAVNQPSALELLRERYARGEIDTDTFSDMVERLEAPTAPADHHDPFPATRP